MKYIMQIQTGCCYVLEILSFCLSTENCFLCAYEFQRCYSCLRGDCTKRNTISSLWNTTQLGFTKQIVSNSACIKRKQLSKSSTFICRKYLLFVVIKLAKSTNQRTDINDIKTEAKKDRSSPCKLHVVPIKKRFWRWFIVGLNWIANLSWRTLPAVRLNYGQRE